ncbi:MAG: hypothetical protein IJ867_02265 [Clostridia bacterium]|nr:hypothetical protein [Clostridia bacterium]
MAQNNIGIEERYQKAASLNGEEKAKIEIAKKMKIEKLDISLIEKMTGLTKEEIEKL